MRSVCFRLVSSSRSPRVRAADARGNMPTAEPVATGAPVLGPSGCRNLTQLNALGENVANAQSY
jgi:hypothetical protein